MHVQTAYLREETKPEMITPLWCWEDRAEGPGKGVL